MLSKRIADNNSIGVIDLQTSKLKCTWKPNSLKANFPMALDSTGNHVFIGFRQPAMLVSYDAVTGKEQGRTVLVDDADDVFFYKKAQEIFASGGDGFINIFKKENNTDFTKIADIPTRSGARTSLLVPALQTYIVAERAANNKAATLAVYKIAD